MQVKTNEHDSPWDPKPEDQKVDGSSKLYKDGIDQLERDTLRIPLWSGTASSFIWFGTLIAWCSPLWGPTQMPSISTESGVLEADVGCGG